MKRMYDFHCNHCDELTERYTDEDTRTVTCSFCEGTATRIVSAPMVKLEGITGAFPGAYDRWERVRNEKLQQERKKAADAGT